MNNNKYKEVKVGSTPLRIRDPGLDAREDDMQLLNAIFNNRVSPAFVDFIQQANGGEPSRAWAKVGHGQRKEEEFGINLFLSLGTGGTLKWTRDIVSTYALMASRGLVLATDLPIASTVDGNLLCLATDERNCGKIYMCETGPTSSYSCCLVANDLVELVEKLEEI